MPHGGCVKPWPIGHHSWRRSIVTGRAECPRLPRPREDHRLAGRRSPRSACSLIVFAESGLLIGFFLPGDSLLFTAGLLVVAGPESRLELLGAPRRVLHRRRDRRPGRLLVRQARRPVAVPPAELPPVQTGVRAADEGLLRAPRPEDDRAGALRSRRAHLRADPRRRRRDAVPARSSVTTWSAASSGRSASSLRATCSGETIPSIDKYLLPIIFVIVLLSLIPPFIEWRKHRRQVAPVSAADAEREADELEDLLDGEN